MGPGFHRQQVVNQGGGGDRAEFFGFEIQIHSRRPACPQFGEGFLRDAGKILGVQKTRGAAGIEFQNPHAAVGPDHRIVAAHALPMVRALGLSQPRQHPQVIGKIGRDPLGRVEHPIHGPFDDAVERLPHPAQRRPRIGIEAERRDGKRHHRVALELHALLGQSVGRRTADVAVGRLVPVREPH